MVISSRFTSSPTSWKVCGESFIECITCLRGNRSIPACAKGRHFPCPWWHANSRVQGYRDRSFGVLHCRTGYCHPHRLVAVPPLDTLSSEHPFQRETPSSVRTRKLIWPTSAMTTSVAAGNRWPKFANWLSCPSAIRSCSNRLVSSPRVVS